MTRKSLLQYLLLVFGTLLLIAFGYLVVTRLQDPQDTNPTSDTSQAPATEYSAPNTPNVDECPTGRPPTMLNLGGEDVRICGQQTDGTVSSVNSSSIVVATDNGAQTFAITSATLITQQGEARSVNDIEVGDTVAILPADADANQAGRILLNPSFARP